MLLSCEYNVIITNAGTDWQPKSPFDAYGMRCGIRESKLHTIEAGKR